MKVFIDYETMSDLDITKVGAVKYMNTPHSDIICMSYAIDPPPYGQGEVKLWLPGAPAPVDWSKDGVEVYSFNALFEYRVTNILGKKWGLPHLPLSNCVDVQALCGRYTYPQQLARAGEALELNIQKDPVGKRLMKIITQPPFKYTKQQLHQFYNYCLTDTKTMIDMVRHLPSDILSGSEQRIWETTQRINLRGIPVDTKLATRIVGVVSFYKERELKKVPILTDGKVNKVTQTAVLKDWCGEQGVNLPNLQKETVQNYLDSPEAENFPVVTRVLKMRLEFNRSSLAKYSRLLSQSYKGRIYDNLRYYGASTGRWAGMGFQAHNLPRASVDDIDKTIQAFENTSILDGDPMYSAMALLRSTITAPEGYVLAVADYKSVENRILAWVSGEERILRLFYKGLDEYKDFASDIFSVKYDDVTKEQRFFSKVVILGAGYGLGGKGFLKYAEGYGISITPDEADRSIGTYRETHKRVRQLWYALKEAAVNAISFPGEVFSVNSTMFRVVRDGIEKPWLTMELPSGRKLFYERPKVEEDMYGLVPTHMGWSGYTHKWQRQRIIPGRLTENVVQALARDILAYGKEMLEEMKYKTILSVHDEVIVEVPDINRSKTLEEVIDLMCTLPSWAVGLPLEAEGEVVERYQKI